MITKELKNKWIEALKSGKYTRGTFSLYTHSSKTHCCLGVLAEINPDMKISVDGYECVVNGAAVAYGPFYSLLGAELLRPIIKANDSVVGIDDPSYNVVLPLIEALPTSD